MQCVAPGSRNRWDLVRAGTREATRGRQRLSHQCWAAGDLLCKERQRVPGGQACAGVTVHMSACARPLCTCVCARECVNVLRVCVCTCCVHVLHFLCSGLGAALRGRVTSHHSQLSQSSLSGVINTAVKPAVRIWCRLSASYVSCVQVRGVSVGGEPWSWGGWRALLVAAFLPDMASASPASL